MADIRTETLDISVPGGNMYLKQWIPAAGCSEPPIVLLHDSLGCIALWRRFPEALSRALQRRVVAYDRLGFGQSDARQAPPSIAFIDEEASIYFPAVHEQLALDRFVLLGHSVGGGMALRIAAGRQDCEAVISIAAQTFLEARTIQGIRRARQSFAQPGQMDRLKKWHGNKAAWVLSAWVDLWLSEAFSDWNLESTIRAVRCPILAIHGDDDEFGSIAFPESIIKYAGGPAEMLSIQAGGHMPHQSNTAMVIGAIQQFLISKSKPGL